MGEIRKLFIELGYTEEDYLEIKNSHSLEKMKEETLIKKVKENYDFLVSLGYSQEDVIKMTKSSPSIYNYSIENIKQKIEDMEKLGYSQEDVIKMTKSLPTIYGLSIDNIKQKIEDMEELGYSQEDVIKMTKSLPTIYGLSIENLKQKIEFYDSIGLHSLVIKDTKQLMQSTKLSYARYMFYKEKGIIIDEKNYSKLFIGQKRFEKTYGITKESLLEMYPYEDGQEGGDKKEKSTQELGRETLETQKDVSSKAQMRKMLYTRANEKEKQEYN